MFAASIQNLTVKYGSFTALNGFSVDLPTGCVGLLGPNGAGKTTLIKTLLGLVQPASGGGTVLGHDLGRDGALIRQMVGYMPEQDCHLPGMTGVQYVAYAAELSGLPTNQAMLRAHEVLEYAGLGEARYRMVDTYSLGMKQRIKFAQAIAHGPKLLLLDEPTNGLDPRGREEMLGMVRRVSDEQDVSVVVSSHLLVDIERTCEHVIVVTQGRLSMSAPISEIRGLMTASFDMDLSRAVDGFFERLAEAGLHVEALSPTKARVSAGGEPGELSQYLFSQARSSGAVIRRMTPARRTLEDVFLEAIREHS